MIRSRTKAGLVFLTACVCAAALWAAGPATEKKIRSLSEVIDTASPFSLVAVLPDVAQFTEKLRGGQAMRAFFDSPLGLHFLRSAPLRSAAYLHRLVSLAPGSWQWNLYSMITAGPVVYRAQGKRFVLLVALSGKGKLITSLLPEARAAREGDWLVIGSDSETVQKQIAYMRSPAIAAFALDAALERTATLSIAWGAADAPGKNRSLTRALVRMALGLEGFTGCRAHLTAAGESLSFEGECPQKGNTAGTFPQENLPVGQFPAYCYFTRPGAAVPHALALGGFTLDYGYAVPHLFYSGPVSDQKSIEFLSQAFKSRGHKLENAGEGIKIVFPSPYAYRDRKFDLFAPHLVADRSRFYWQSYVPASGIAARPVKTGQFRAYASVQILDLIRKSEATLRQYDAVYSPGHFHEFRDALLKSAPALKNAVFTAYATNASDVLRIGGEFSFAQP